MKNILIGLFIAALLIGASALLLVTSGGFPVAATTPEPPWVRNLIHSVYDSAVTRGARDIARPADLGGEDQILRGARSFQAMCSICHTPPGAATSVQAAGMNPSPPQLTELLVERTPAEAYWVITNGVRMTGMPAFGPTHEPEQLWELVAFLRDERSRTGTGYAELLARAQQRLGADDGHDHSHGEDNPDDTPMSGESIPAGKTEQGHGEHDRGNHPHGHADLSTTSSLKHSHPHEPVGPNNISARLLHALDEGDATQVEALLWPDVLIYESGGIERGFAEYARHHMPADMAFASAVERQPLDHKLYELGDHAIYAGSSRLSGEFKGRPIDLITTETLLLRRDADSGWRVQHIHWSSGKEH